MKRRPTVFLWCAAPVPFAGWALERGELYVDVWDCARVPNSVPIALFSAESMPFGELALVLLSILALVLLLLVYKERQIAARQEKDISARKRIEGALQQKTRLQELLMNMSTQYINLPLASLDPAVGDSLAEMAEFVGADRAYVFDYDFQRQICVNTHEWCRPGIEPQIDELQAVPLEPIPEWVGPHSRGEPLYVPDVSALPSSTLREILEPQAIQSLLTVPLMNGDECMGFVGFDSVRDRHVYSEVEQHLLRVFANMLVNVRLRKLAGDAIHDSEQSYREIFNATSDAIFIHDADTGAVLDVNDSMLQMYGFTREEAMRLHPNDSSSGVSPYSAQEARQWIAKAAAEGPQTFEWHARKKSGDLFWVEVALKGATIRGQHRILAVVRDITTRKLAETEREHLQERLRQAQKMESIGRLAGGVAHDFNNLLMGIMNYTELCRDGVEPDHAIRPWLDEITADAQRSAAITRQLLAFARKQTIAPRNIDLNRHVESMLKLLRRLIGEDIDLAWTPRTSSAIVRMDPSQVDQILANLVVNARDAIAGVGEVTIETGTVVFDETRCTSHADIGPGDYVVLSVRDTGCGMDEATVRQIFEPFYTNKNVKQGVGLGLATVYGILRQNEGFVDVDSEPDKGTTFRLYLPHCREHAEEKSAVDSSACPTGQETILLVEDERSIRVTTQVFLQRLGYTVLAAETPADAIRLAAEHPHDIQLLITDVIMPGMNGRELADRLVEERPGLRRLFMSGYPAATIAPHGVLDQDVDFQAKPFNREELACKVRQVLDRPQS